MLRRVLMTTFITLTGAYGLNISGFLLLRSIFGERWNVIGLFDSFAHLLMIPALPLLILSLVLKRRWLALTQAIPAFVFLTSYGGMFIPKRSVTASTSDLTVLTYNIHHGYAPDIAPIIDVIRQSNADIVAIQELSQDAADAFAAQLADMYPYRAFHPMKKAWQGQGILSRYPITADEYWRNEQFGFGLGHQRVEMDIQGTTITIYNTHPAHPGMSGTFYNGAPHREEMDIVMNRAAQDTTPVLIMGDFNMGDQSEDYRRISAVYADSYREMGWGMGFTFPDLRVPQALPDYINRTIPLPPFMRLDYVFHSAAFQTLDARVWSDAGGSDHHPVFVRFSLDGQ